MEAKAITDLAPLAAPILPNPEKAIFNDDQYRILRSILEVFLPPTYSKTNQKENALQITPERYASIEKALEPFLPDSTEQDQIRKYLEEDVVSNPEYTASLQKRFHYFVPHSASAGLSFILGTLNTRLGAMLLTGTSTILYEMPLRQRVVLVSGWSNARLPLLRAIFWSLKTLAIQSYMPLSSTINKVLDFPDVPKHVERSDTFEFQFKDFSNAHEPISIEADAVIVGSGCGAGVMASHLARAGLKVSVVEKSYHFPSSHYPMSTNASGENLMEGGGSILSDDSSTVVLAGSTWGGGGTVNWSASLQPQHFVREEWASSPHNLPFFTSEAFQDCLDTVCSRMGVAKITDHEGLSNIKHNFANTTLIEGARKLGMSAETVPQNTAGRNHACGSCCMEGCASTTKQGPANYWFPHAASHGAEFIQGCFVTSIIFSSDKVATGVHATWTSPDRLTTHPLTIHARRVIVSAGTLHSPLLLLRSGIENPHIGSHLHLHPTSQLQAIFPHRTNPWEGNMLTAAVTSLEHMNSSFGPKIECNTSTPVYNLVWMPWNPSLSRTAPYHHTPAAEPTEVDDHIASSVLDFKIRAAKFGHSVNFISLQRDHGEGRVYIDPDDKSRSRVRVSYTPRQRDCEGIFAGLIAAARIAYVQGAIEIDHGNPEYVRFYRPEPVSGESEERTKNRQDEAFESWIQGWRDVGGVKVGKGMMFGSAHQMGTCRMSADASKGVVDGEGRVWGYKGVWVADASVFPSASGVNPMATNMGISEWIGRGIVRGWNAERGTGR